MKTRKLTSTVVLCLAISSLCHAADSPFMGTWKLNEAKSKIPAGAAKNTTVVYAAAAGGMTSVTTDGVDRSGKPTHSEWTGKFDGKPYPVTGTPGTDSRSVTAKDDRTLEIANMNGGKVVGTGKTEVAKDGKTRTLETETTGPDGKKSKAKFEFDKQ